MLHEGQAIVAASQAEATRHCLGVEAVLVLAPEVSPGSPPRPARCPAPWGHPLLVSRAGERSLHPSAVVSRRPADTHYRQQTQSDNGDTTPPPPGLQRPGSGHLQLR